MDPTVLKAVLETPAEGEDQFIATLKSAGMTDQAKIDAAVTKYRMQKGLADKFDDGDDDVFLKAAGLEVTPKADPKKDEPAKKSDPKPDESAVAKAVSALGPELKAILEPIIKSNAEKDVQIGELSTVVKSLQEDKVTATYVQKADKLDFVPGNSEKLGLMMKSAYGVSDDFGKQIETLFGQVNTIVEKSSLLTSAGHPFLTEGQDAWTEIEEIAKGMVQKSSDASMTQAKAIDLVLKTESGADLYRRYLKENPAQRAQYFV